MYSLNEDRREEVSRAILEIRRLLDVPPTAPTSILADFDGDDELTPLTLFESIVRDFAADRVLDRISWQERLARARVRSRAAAADLAELRIAGRPEEVADVERRFKQASETLEAEERRGQALIRRDSTEKLDASGGLVVLGRDGPAASVEATLRLLLDWSRRPADAESSTDPVPTLPDWAPDAMAALLYPARMLMRSASNLSIQELAGFGAQLIGRLESAEGREVASLAVSAAVTDISGSAELIAAALLRPRIADSVSPAELQLCLLSLARLARPCEHGLAAAAACFHLLSRNPANTLAVPILVPAALSSPGADAGWLLNELARTLYDETGLREQWRARVDEGAVMRNLAWSMRGNHYKALQTQLAFLVSRKYGLGMLQALFKDKHGALQLQDRNGETSFEVSAGEILAERAGLQDEPVPLMVDSHVGGKLTRLLVRREPQDPKPDSLSALLSSVDRHAFTVIEGGRSAQPTRAPR